MIRKEELFGVEYTVGSAKHVIRLIADQFGPARTGPSILMHCHVHTLRLSRSIRKVQSTLKSPNTTVLFEGIGLKTAVRLLGRGNWPDVNGTDLVPEFLRTPEAAGLRVAFVGAATGVAERAAANIPGTWEKCLLMDGYADLADEDAARERLAAARPDLILLALGTPRQEATALAWSQSLPDSVIWCVGGMFDIISGEKPRAPRMVRRIRLEWFWRFMLDPATHWRRLAIGIPWLLREIYRAKVSLKAPALLDEGPSRWR